MLESCYSSFLPYFFFSVRVFRCRLSIKLLHLSLYSVLSSLLIKVSVIDEKNNRIEIFAIFFFFRVNKNHT